MNATFGNATELIIGVLGLSAGLIEVVKASITGSIIGNLLLVLGFSMFLGGWRREKQTFNRTAMLASASALFLAVIALVMPALFSSTVPDAAPNVVESLSVLVSLVLLIVYAAGLWFSLRTHKHLYLEEVGKYEARWGVARALTVLTAATLSVAVMSDILVNSIRPLVSDLGWTQLFIGVIFVAIVGNAAEHVSALTTARKNRMDLSLQISIGSATQISMFVAPLLVLASVLVGQPMSLVFNAFELAAMVLSVVIVYFVIADGESNWLEGAQLLAAYAIMAAAFFFHP